MSVNSLNVSNSVVLQCAVMQYCFDGIKSCDYPDAAIVPYDSFSICDDLSCYTNYSCICYNVAYLDDQATMLHSAVTDNASIITCLGNCVLNFIDPGTTVETLKFTPSFACPAMTASSLLNTTIINIGNVVQINPVAYTVYLSFLGMGSFMYSLSRGI